MKRWKQRQSGISTILVLIFMPFIHAGCATMDQLREQYPGYTVVEKEQRTVTKSVPVWTFACVTPYGNTKCKVRAVGRYPNPGVNSCSINCGTDREPPDKWIKRQIGTTQRNDYKYYLKLRAPSGEVVEEEVVSPIFNEVYEGQKL